jgi:ABC-2 type transport system ATP-binding protein
VIEAVGISRSYVSRFGRIEAVADVTLNVGEGEIVGFLGPNGAGKTTTVRMLATLLTPTGGTAKVAGYDVVADRAKVRQVIGYVAQASMATDHRVVDELVTQGRLFGMPKRDAQARATELTEQYELESFALRPLRQLSGGQRRRFDIAAGMVNRPNVLFLDEPTVGLDPQSRANVWDHVRALRDESGTTVFLTTHYLDEADALCDRILVIDGGRIVASDTPTALKASLGGDVVTIKSPDAGAVARVTSSLLGAAAGADVKGDTVTLHVPQAARRLPELLRTLDAAGIALTSIATAQPSLDDVFFSLTGRSLRESLPAGPIGVPATSAPTPPVGALVVPESDSTAELQEVLTS